MTLPHLRLSDLSTPLRWLLGLLALIGSLQLAVVLIAVYAGVLAWATVVRIAEKSVSWEV